MGGSEDKLGAGNRREGRLEGKREAAGARHGRLTRGRRSSTPQETGCLRSGGNKRPPPGSQSRGGAVRDEGLSRLRKREAVEGGGGPAASAAPSPGVSARDTPSPGPGRRRRRRAVTSLELRRRTQPPPAGRGRGQRRGSSAARPGNRLRLQRCSGTNTDPRDRHDGLRAAPQRGQAPPLAPPPATSGARLPKTWTLLTPLLGTRPGLPALVSLPTRT